MQSEDKQLGESFLNMNVEIKYGKIIKDFVNKATITIGSDDECDFKLNSNVENILIKLVYSSKYNNYVLVNSSNSGEVFFNNKPFSKVLVPVHFSINLGGSDETIA